jgi:hypothetical protein
MKLIGHALEIRVEVLLLLQLQHVRVEAPTANKTDVVRISREIWMRGVVT